MMECVYKSGSDTRSSSYIMGHIKKDTLRKATQFEKKRERRSRKVKKNDGFSFFCFRFTRKKTGYQSILHIY